MKATEGAAWSRARIFVRQLRKAQNDILRFWQNALCVIPLPSHSLISFTHLPITVLLFITASLRGIVQSWLQFR